MGELLGCDRKGFETSREEMTGREKELLPPITPCRE